MSNGERGTVAVLIHGSGHTAEHWQPLQERLGRLGRTSIAASLPATRPDATYDDYAAAVAEAVKPAIEEGLEIDAVAHSGGSHTVPRFVELVKQLGGSVRSIVHISGSLGEPSSNDNNGVRDAIDLLRTRVPLQRRHTDEFQRAIRPGPDNLITFDPALVRRLFFHDCPPDVFIWALENMQPQARPKDEPPLEAHRQPDIRQFYLLPREDKIRNHPWAVEAAGRLGMTIVDMQGGHSPAISRPGQLAILLTTLWDSLPGEPATAELQLPNLAAGPGSLYPN